ncbi:hypothetical protein [Bacillus sp. JCM 19034]|uniref:hypothetical protein n=1 Tax=Bacillus sp. JCM 19034 TaxID=1481928 RepID=UPI0012E2379E|nr:hypothetical protein [Bacillus sp. JCM 19034]
MKKFVSDAKRGKIVALQAIIDEAYEDVQYNQEDSIELLEQKKNVIQAGNYYLKLK